MRAILFYVAIVLCTACVALADSASVEQFTREEQKALKQVNEMFNALRGKENRRIAESVSLVQQVLLAKRQENMRLAMELHQLRVSNLSVIKSRQDTEVRIAKIKDAQKLLNEQMVLTQSFPQLIEMELRKRNVSEKTIKRTLTNIQKGYEISRELRNKTFTTNVSLLDSLMKLQVFAANNLGSWEVGTESKQIQFESDALADEYNTIVDELVANEDKAAKAELALHKLQVDYANKAEALTKDLKDCRERNSDGSGNGKSCGS